MDGKVNGYLNRVHTNWCLDDSINYYTTSDAVESSISGQ